MNNTAFNYVRTHRQRHLLTEDELAFLVSDRSRGQMSRIELGRFVPSLTVGLALQVLFHQQPREMFPGLYETAQDEIMRRARTFLEDLEGRQDRAALAKRALLERLPREDEEEIEL